MKLSFSLPPKPSSKSKPNLKASTSSNFSKDDDRENNTSKPEYLTEFDPSKTLTDNQSRQHIIPPKENEWRPLKKMKNLDLPVRPDSDPDLRFELESPALADIHDPSNMSYGLNLRQSSAKDDAAAADSNDGGHDRPRSNAVENVLLDKLRDDLQRLPEDRGFEEFADVPVEGFGAALLRGYGWYEGRGIGKNAKEDVKVKEYNRRTDKEGLGFLSDVKTRSTESERNARKEKKETKEKERPREKERDDRGGLFVGKDVRIIEGRDAGLKGRVLKLLNDRVVLKLSRSEEEVNVRVRDVADLGSKEEEKCLKKLKELNIRDGKDSDDRKLSKRSREGGIGADNGASYKTDNHREELKSSQVSWLTSHIRVRVISKDFKRGRFYLKKGQIVDVVGPNTCDVTMDENTELIQGVDQGVLETALPRRGGPVLVLNGKYKGVYGSLVERDLDRDTAVVRDADSHALLNVRLDQIAEYIGDPSYIGF